MGKRLPRRRPRLRASVLSFVIALAVVSSIAASGSGGNRSLSAAPANTVAPKVNGTLTEGATLAANPGTWTTDSPPLAFAFQWFRCDGGGGSCVATSGATQQAYTLQGADVSHTILVQVTAIDSTGTPSSAAVNSPASGIIKGAGDPVAAPVNVIPPSVGGQTVQGMTLTAFVGEWNGIPVPTFTYLWSRCGPTGNDCNPITGATSATYTLGAADLATTLRVQVSATNSQDTAAANSPVTSIVTIPLGPENIQAPTVTGTAETGETLTATKGEWSGATPITFTYQWQRCDSQGQNCKPIQGATNQAYVLQSADLGSRLVVVVTVTNAYGSSSESSAAAGVVTSGIPAGGTISVSQVALPNPLLVSTVEFAPTVLRSRAPFTARFRVTDAQGHPVSGAEVWVLTIPFDRVGPAGTRATGQDGWATFTLFPTAKMPLRHGFLITVYTRATKPGEPVLGGVSARRLSSLPIDPS
jgi:hypothetical protein